MTTRAPELQACKVLVPRANARDAAACETMLAALVALDDERRSRRDKRPHSALALEIAGRAGELMFILRGDAVLLAQARAQLAAAYPQCAFVDLDATSDPLRYLGSAPHQLVREVRQTRAMHLPLLTHRTRDVRAAGAAGEVFGLAVDPMVALARALESEQADSVSMVQFALAPLDTGWATHFRSIARKAEVQERATMADAARSPLGATSPFILLSALLGLSGAGFLWLASEQAMTGLPVLLGWIFIALAVLFVPLWGRSTGATEAQLTSTKCSRPALAVRARVFVGDQSPDTAAVRLRQIDAALRGYALPGGNALKLVSTKCADPADIVVPLSRGPVLVPTLAYRARPGGAYGVFSVDELASLWHLPHGEAALQSVAYTSSKRLLPLPDDVAHGLYLGVSSAPPRTIDVRLSREALRGNIGLVAKTQSGKSNAMALLIEDVIKNEPDATVIVLDPHRSLVDRVAGLIPSDCATRAIYWSLADRERPFGFNVIERKASRHGAHADKLVSDLIGAMEIIWPNSWGDRMQSYFQTPLLTLARANDALVTRRSWAKAVGRARRVLDAHADEIAAGALGVAARHDIGGALESLDGEPKPTLMVDAAMYTQAQGNAEDWRTGQDALDTGKDDGMAKLLAAARGLGETLGVGSSGKPPHDLRLRFIDRSDVKDPNEADWPLQYTLLDVNAMLTNRPMREIALSGLSEGSDAHLLRWWPYYVERTQIENKRLYAEMIGPVLRKINEFTMSDVARRIFGQPESTLDLASILSHGGILLIDLAAGEVGRDISALIGSMVLNLMAHEIYNRQSDSSSRPARRVFLVVDEFQSIPGANYAFMLSELAKYGVQLVLGTQSLGVLNETNREARLSWLANVSTLFVFRSGAEDCRVLADELSIGARDGTTVEESDINGLPDYACFVRTRGKNGAPTVFRLDTRKAPDGDQQARDRLIEASRMRYGVDAVLVDRWLDVASQFHVLDSEAPKPRPPKSASDSKGRSRDVPKFAAGSQPEDKPRDADYASEVPRQDDAHDR